MIRSIGGSNDELSIVSGFDRTFYDAFKNALDRGQPKVQLKILHFIQKEMIQAYGRNSVAVMQQLNWLPAALYKISSGNAEASKTIALEFGSFFKTISWFFITEDPIKDPINDHPVRFHLYFTTVMNFYHYAIHHPDEALVRGILRDFESIGDNDYDFDTRMELQDAAKLNPSEKKSIRERATKKHLMMITKRRAILTLIAWLTFLFTMDKLSEERYKFLIEQFDLKYHFFEELLDDIDFIRSNEARGFLGIDFWDYMERESGVTYSPPSAYDWILYGPAMLLLREDLPNFNEQVIINDRQHAFLLEAIKVKLNIIEKQLSKFKEILGWENTNLVVDEQTAEERLKVRFEERKIHIINIFRTIKVLNEEEDYRQLIARPLDVSAISDFYDKLYEKWRNNCFSYRLFAENDNIELLSNVDGLDYHGESILLEHQRSMFAEGEKQTIHGSEDLGSAVGRSIDEQFVYKITQLSPQQQTTESLDYDSVTSGLDASITSLRSNGFEPDMIILSSDPFYKSDLINSKKYKRGNFPQPGPQIGFYDEIPVMRLFSQGLNSKGIVTSFAKGLSLILWEDNSLYKNILQLKLKELSSEEILKEYDLDTSRWSINNDGSRLTEEQAKLRLAASLTLEMWTRGKFIIRNPKAITWCKFTAVALK